MKSTVPSPRCRLPSAYCLLITCPRLARAGKKRQEIFLQLLLSLPAREPIINGQSNLVEGGCALRLLEGVAISNDGKDKPFTGGQIHIAGKGVHLLERARLGVDSSLCTCSLEAPSQCPVHAGHWQGIKKYVESRPTCHVNQQLYESFWTVIRYQRAGDFKHSACPYLLRQFLETRARMILGLTRISKRRQKVFTKTGISSLPTR